MSNHREITPHEHAMDLFIDTEFSSLHAPELLSVGLVADDGREFYVEISDDRIPVNAFVMREVLPQWGLVRRVAEAVAALAT